MDKIERFGSFAVRLADNATAQRFLFIEGKIC